MNMENQDSQPSIFEELQQMLPDRNANTICNKTYKVIEEALKNEQDPDAWNQLELYLRKWLDKSSDAIEESREIIPAEHGKDTHNDMVFAFTSLCEGFDCLLEYVSTRDENLLFSGFKAISEGEIVLAETEKAFNGAIEEPFEAYF